MKSYSRIAACTLILFSLLFSLSCSGTSVDPEAANKARGSDLDRLCSSGTPETRKDELVELIAKDIQGYSELASQISSGRASYNVGTVQYNNREIIFVKAIGALTWTKNKDSKESTLENFLDVLDDYMRKGCVEKVIFAPTGARLTPDVTDGFEWTLCEAPKNPCSDGTCSAGCLMAAPAGTPSNSNSYSNGNTPPANNSALSNANANSNGRPPSNK